MHKHPFLWRTWRHAAPLFFLSFSSVSPRVLFSFIRCATLELSWIICACTSVPLHANKYSARNSLAAAAFALFHHTHLHLPRPENTPVFFFLAYFQEKKVLILSCFLGFRDHRTYSLSSISLMCQETSPQVNFPSSSWSLQSDVSDILSEQGLWD